MEYKKDVVYVVKSHQRVDRFKPKTYEKIIVNYGFELAKVYVFVSTESDVKLYSEAYPDINIVLAPAGVAAVDNFITDYFPAGQKIIYMNDDVSALMRVTGENKFANLTTEELEEFCQHMFDVMHANRITYGGLYAVANTMFMAGGEEYRTGLCFIMDPFSFCINNKEIKLTNSDKSDFEKSILHYISKGAILRCNRITFKVENYTRPGGFQGRTVDTEMAASIRLQKDYPAYVSHIVTKADKTTTIRLNKLPANRHIDLLDGTEAKKQQPSLF